MVKPPLLEDFYTEVEENSLEWMRYLQRDCGEMAKIREDFSDDWEVEELTRSILFGNTQIIEALRKEVEYARSARKKSARIFR